MDSLENYISNMLKTYSCLSKPKPKVTFPPCGIYIEPTNACNLNCAICGRKNMRRRIGFMRFADFKRIIDKLAKAGWFIPLTLTGQGEPLLNKELFLMVNYANKKGFSVSLISNSTLLDKDKISLLFKARLDRYQTMFDSLDKNSYERIRYRANYEKTKNNIINLIQANEKAGHPLYISIGMVETSLTKDPAQTIRFWKSFPIDNFCRSQLFTLQSDSGKYQEAIEKVKGRKRDICVLPFINLSISYDGNAVLCCHDFNNLWVVGNIFKDSLQKIWNGKKAQKLRRALLTNRLCFFNAIRHNCARCNIPYIEEYTISGFREAIPTQISRRASVFKTGKKAGYANK